MSSKIVSYLTSDETVNITVANTTQMVYEMEKLHSPSAAVTAGMGRILTVTSIMGSSLKGQNDSVTVRFDGGGPAGIVTAVSDSGGNAKISVTNPIVEIPLNSKGKLDVSGALGNSGTLYVIKDLGLKQPFTGTVAVVSGEVAEDFTNYFAISEQIPTVCGLGVLVNPDLSVKHAGGFLIQLMPGYTESDIDLIENNIKNIPSVTKMLESGMSTDQIAHKALDGFKIHKVSEKEVQYRCTCSREKAERAIMYTGVDEIRDMISEGKPQTVECHFCNKVYSFDTQDLTSILNRLENENNVNSSKNQIK